MDGITTNEAIFKLRPQICSFQINNPILRGNLRTKSFKKNSDKTIALGYEKTTNR